ncbi:MAG: succinate--CoA ligase subunit alpha [Elusimicrobia bacterium HGW-Elusimicrobia-4]|nr:MAG: succinate--CoA ligase subunit alpha [Elusimicrobia bacterium HGW-Elusimicrobia-4]
MSILINKNTNVIIQGITGKEGQYHTKLMLEFGTKIVGGVTPGKGGQEVLGVPVFNSISELMSKTGAKDNVASGIFAPTAASLSAVKEAIENNIKMIVLIAEGIPLSDVLRIVSLAKKNNVTLIGPNTPGLLSSDGCKIGILATQYIKKGNIGVVSRSGTLTAEITQNLHKSGYGETSVIGIGGDPVIGTGFATLLEKFFADNQTEAVVMVGEVGGTLEEEAAEFIKKSKNKKPVVAFVAGQNVPEGKRFGHAGAIVQNGVGTAKGKIEALKSAGVSIAGIPWEIGKILEKLKISKKIYE